MDAQPERGIVIAPMSVGEVVDSGFRLGRRNFRHLAGIGAWGIVAGYVLLIIFSIPVSSDPSPESMVSVAIGSIIAGLGYGLAGIATVIACARLIDPVGRAGRMMPGEAYRYAIGRVVPLLGLGMLIGMSLILFLIFPAAIYVWVRWANAGNAVIIDRQGPIAALGRSWMLTRNVWWHTAIVLFISSLAIGIVQGVLSGVIQFAVLVTEFALRAPFLTAALGAVVNSAVAIVITPFATSVAVVLYYELRARAEGFDLERRLLQATPAE